MRIAFATNNGLTVNEKFCNCHQFSVYDTKDKKLIETRSALLLGDYTSEDVKDDYLSQIFDLLSDCQMICAAGFSFYTFRKLREKGIASMKTKARISDLIPKRA